MSDQWFRVGSDEVRLLRDGAGAFPPMLAAIASAKREVLLEMYWIGDDECGRRFRDALVERAKSGVVVRVIVDAVGSFGLTPAFWTSLVQAGGRVIEYHPIRALVRRLDLARLDRRDHRKILVADGAVGFVGGINLTRHWLPVGEGGEGWRDDAAELRGPIAEDLRSIFYETWRRVGGGRRPADVAPFPRTKPRPAWIIASGSARRRRTIRREYLRRISQAKRSVDITNSYFVPDRSVRRALFAAAERGVRVRVLVPAKSDVAIVQLASEALFEPLLRNGVEVYAYPDTILHAKTGIVDDEFTMIGSYNFDERSFRKNLEVNAAVEDAAFARHVRLWFEHDLAMANRIQLGDWDQRGLAKRGAEYVAYALRKFL